MIDPNPIVPTPEDVPDTNPLVPEPDGTETPGGEATVPLEKFKHSQAEAIRLYKENEELKKALEQGGRPIETPPAPSINNNPEDEPFPGFNLLDEDAQANLLDYTKNVVGLARKEIFSDPAIAHSRRIYLEKKFDDALAATINQHPDLSAHRDAFKAEYYNPLNVPDNIEELLQGFAKIYLYDQAKAIGAAEALEQAERVELETVGGGDKAPTATRTIEEWNELAKRDPAAFAAQSKTFNEDLAAGRI